MHNTTDILVTLALTMAGRHLIESAFGPANLNLADEELS